MSCHCTIIKRRPDGSEAARYQGVRLEAQAGWQAARAVWGYRTLDAGYMVFEHGDELDEFFSLERGYNVFALYRGGRDLVGWYCNVTLPTVVEGDTIIWHDLYIDIIRYPNGQWLLLDMDELMESDLESRDPARYAAILEARDELLELMRAGAYPFSGARPPEMVPTRTKQAFKA
ncbi:MAG: DUF402 domain-containing protein [Chloroflexi bacterium]|nr:MAG: DUF402 domain-containing protein [Chloroflexota bacterium]